MPAIPSAAIGRLVTYLRILGQLEAAGIQQTSSGDLAREAQVSAFQVRKDLTRFGSFGKRGAGYTVATLRREIRAILGLTRAWNVALVGMGRLGQAIADYPNFDEYDFSIRAFFDVDERKVGSLISGIEVSHPRDMSRVVAEREIDIGFITVPQGSAQTAADDLVAAGVQGILNFAPTIVNVPPSVKVETVDFLAGLKRLAFYLKPQVEGEPVAEE
ncbi:MAG TPA: redox-sensing transcriptional repressor Rex [Trueperaceae bacterium]